MKPNYKNWMPKGMVLGFFAAAAVALVLLLVFGVVGIGVSGMLRTVLTVVFAIAFVALLAVSCWGAWLYCRFSYNGKRQLSRQIVEGTANYVTLPDGGRGLDVGCGSGALTIACAKRNPQGQMLGIDRWGKEYASFSKPLCQSNATAEGVDNVTFEAADAVSLPYQDESFDAVTSNYVYHNIVGHDKQQVVLETLRVLKKGGCFAIHDIMAPRRYGDMQAFAQSLRDMGYQKVELIDTTDGMFMSKREAFVCELSGSCLLTGIK